MSKLFLFSAGLIVSLHTFAIKPKSFHKSIPPVTQSQSQSSLSIDTLKQKIDLDFNLNNGTADSIQKINFTVLRNEKELIWDAGQSLKIKNIFLNKSKVNFNHKNNTLSIKANFQKQIKYELKIEYSLDLFKNKAFSYLKKSSQIYQISTFTQPSLARHWFVSNDTPHDKFIYELEAKVPFGFELMSNGNLLSSPSKSPFQKSFFHYKMDKSISSYLVSLVIGKFHKYDQHYPNIQLFYWLDSFSWSGLEFFFETENMLNHLENRLGLYPFKKYNITSVRTMDGGGMEHTTATTLSSETVFSYYGRVTSLHELAHHWFGNTVTCHSWDDVWLNESFATFFELDYIEKQFGKEMYFQELIDQRNIYFESEEKNGELGPIFNPKTSPEEKLFSKYGVVTYYKGSLILNYLKSRMGEEPFFHALKSYLNDKKLRFQTASSNDIKEHLQKFTSIDMSLFFDQYINSAGFPELKITQLSDKVFKIEQEALNNVGIYDYELEIKEIFPNGSIVEGKFKSNNKKDKYLSSEELVIFNEFLRFPGKINIQYKKPTAFKILASNKVHYNYAKRILETIQISKKEWISLFNQAVKNNSTSMYALNHYGLTKFKDEQALSFFVQSFNENLSNEILKDSIHLLESTVFSDTELLNLETFLLKLISNNEDKSFHIRYIFPKIFDFFSSVKRNHHSLALSLIKHYEKNDGGRLFKSLLKHLLLNTQSIEKRKYDKYLTHEYNQIRRKTAQLYLNEKNTEATHALGNALLNEFQKADFSPNDTSVIEAFVDTLKAHHTALSKSYLVKMVGLKAYSAIQIKIAQKALDTW